MFENYVISHFIYINLKYSKEWLSFQVEFRTYKSSLPLNQKTNVIKHVSGQCELNQSSQY